MAVVKLLLDEQIIGSKEYFKLLGWTVISVEDVGLRKTGDDAIVKFAKDEDYFVITKDCRMGKKCGLAGVRSFVISDDWIAKKVDADLRDELELKGNR